VVKDKGKEGRHWTQINAEVKGKEKEVKRN